MKGFPFDFDVDYLEKLAFNLSDGWILNRILSEGRSTVYLTNLNNRDYRISIYKSNGYYTITTLLVYSVWGSPEDFSSTRVSIKRDPRHVANELRRKIFSGYDSAITESKDSLLKFQQETVKSDLVTSAISRLFPVYQNGLRTSHLFFSRGNGKPDIDVTRYKMNGNDFDLLVKNIDGELLVKIAAMIKAHEG
ncbi:hypothetical protein AB0001_004777 [Salmonella enterica]|nr:hypothetical protein [Salmonella enterica]EEP3373013.1 hypothetical protein [Salmonella enterica]EFP6579720.1 hypothetical protein [Salmonella enterica]EGC7971003.1 hypothetical protein [Salmonella enterica]EIV4461180.1 hypothetical protein [Salmonella enterica]